MRHAAREDDSAGPLRHWHPNQYPHTDICRRKRLLKGFPKLGGVLFRELLREILESTVTKEGQPRP
jgi:hypothetical protein